MTKAQRRKVIVKRVAAGKMRETWRKKRLLGAPDPTSADEFGGVPDTDTALDELPDSLVG